MSAFVLPPPPDESDTRAASTARLCQTTEEQTGSKGAPVGHDVEHGQQRRSQTSTAQSGSASKGKGRGPGEVRGLQLNAHWCYTTGPRVTEQAAIAASRVCGKAIPTWSISRYRRDAACTQRLDINGESSSARASAMSAHAVHRREARFGRRGAWDVDIALIHLKAPASRRA